MLEPAHAKFNSKTRDYEKGRPSYPEAAIEFVSQKLGLTPEMTVADLGAGTGLLTKSLAKFFADVIAVEPNDEMRSYLGPNAIKGSAENTSLADHSVHAIFAAQAFHWFDPARARAEFERILKEPRAVVLLWNERDATANSGLAKLEVLMTCMKGGSTQRLEADEPAIRNFFGSEKLNSAYFPNPVQLTKEAFCAMVLSRSYAPASGSTESAKLTSELEAIFNEHSNGSLFTVPYRTRIYWGQL